MVEVSLEQIKLFYFNVDGLGFSPRNRWSRCLQSFHQCSLWWWYQCGCWYVACWSTCWLLRWVWSNSFLCGSTQQPHWCRQRAAGEWGECRSARSLGWNATYMGRNEKPYWHHGTVAASWCRPIYRECARCNSTWSST